MALGKRIKELIQSQGMSVKELSDISGVNYGALSSLIRRDSTSTNTENLNRIASALNVQVSELTGINPNVQAILDENPGIEKIDPEVVKLLHDNLYTWQNEQLYELFNKLNPAGKNYALQIIELLLKLSPAGQKFALETIELFSNQKVLQFSGRVNRERPTDQNNDDSDSEGSE